MPIKLARDWQERIEDVFVTELADEAHAVLEKHPGNVPVYLHVEHAEEGPSLKLRAGRIGVKPEGSVMEELKAILGEENVWVSG